MRSFKSNENIHKKEGGSYYVVSANKASSVTLQIWHSKCWCDLENEGKVIKIKSLIFLVKMVFICKFGQIWLIGSGYKMPTRLILTVLIVWWPWKLGQGNMIYSNLLTIPMIQNIKFGQNLSSGSRDSVRQAVFGQRGIWHSKCWCDLENEVRVTKSNPFFPPSQ